MPVMFLRFKQQHLHEMSTNVRYIILLVSAWSAFNGNLMKYSNSAMVLLCVFFNDSILIPSSFTIHRQVTFDAKCEQNNKQTHTHAQRGRENRSWNYRAAWNNENNREIKIELLFTYNVYKDKSHFAHQGTRDQRGSNVFLWMTRKIQNEE